MGTLTPLGENLWVADGPTAIDLLVVPYPTRMTIVRLPSGGLWLSSPVKLPYERLQEVLGLGEVTHLVSATPRHHWRLEPWHTLFPEATLWSCATGPFTLGKRTLPATRLTERTPADWEGALEQAVYPGYGFEETTFFHPASRTLLVEDIIQSHEPRRSALVNAAVRVGGIGEDGGVPRDIRAITRRKEARAWAARVLSWDFDRLVMAHGPVVETGAKAYVERMFAWLL